MSVPGRVPSHASGCRTTACATTPEDIVAFWFPDGDMSKARDHERLWHWRLHGGAHHEVVARYSMLTALAAAGELDDWAHDPDGRLALILILDAFVRSVGSGTSRAYDGDARALDLCLQGLANQHYDALPRVWQQAAFLMPLEHAECDDPARHLAHLDAAIVHADRLVARSPEALRPWYALRAGQLRRHRAVIARFGRYPHRNAILGRTSTPQEMAFVASGDLLPPDPDDDRPGGRMAWPAAPTPTPPCPEESA